MLLHIHVLRYSQILFVVALLLLEVDQGSSIFPPKLTRLITLRGPNITA